MTQCNLARQGGLGLNCHLEESARRAGMAQFEMITVCLLLPEFLDLRNVICAFVFLGMSHGFAVALHK